MTATIQECVEKLLSGEELSWDKHASFAKGSITLETPAQRRLFDFLIGKNQNDVAKGDEGLFDGLVVAWGDDQRDPKDDVSAAEAVEGASGFRLVEIESENFGGLNTFDGPPFTLSVNGESWCLEGQNGSGKTSLASCVIWGLTGRRIVEHVGPHPDEGKRESVLHQETGKSLGAWPPLASYPENVEDLAKDVRVGVRLTFCNTDGEEALVERIVVSKADGDPETVMEAVDPRLTSSQQLMEAGILMPARLNHMGFGEDSASLYDAVKALTGLDQLGAVGDGVANYFCHGGRKFLKYAKDQGIERIKAEYTQRHKAASDQAQEIGLDLSDVTDISVEDIAEKIESLITDLTAKASGYAETLSDVVADDIEVSTPEGRKQVSDAIGVAKNIAGAANQRVSVFATLKALHDAYEGKALDDLPNVIEAAEKELETALDWHRKQIEDEKLRLKALAAQFYNAPQSVDDLAKCPLCIGDLATPEQKELQSELDELRAAGEEAERKLENVCFSIREILMEAVPKDLRRHLEAFRVLEPKTAIVENAEALFVDEKPFSNVLTGAGATIKQVIINKAKPLPVFESGLDALVIDETEPNSAANIRELMHELQQVLELAEWWAANRAGLGQFWKDIVGSQAEEETPVEDSVMGQIKIVEDALAASQPYDAVLVQLNALLDLAKRWHEIMAVQNKRQAIADALEPLKVLRTFVDVEAARSIDELSGGMAACLDRIRYYERLSFADLDLKKKKVDAFGSLFEGMKVDALPIANTSWLKALLWAFIFALREKAIESYGGNPFPLVLLDDPQATFDPRNQIRWAQELSRLSGFDEGEAGTAQIFLTTHSRDFFRDVTGIANMEGQHGELLRVTKECERLVIWNGNILDRYYNKAKDENSDASGREFIRQLRIYIEDLLKFLMRGDLHITKQTTMNALRNRLETLRVRERVSPFTHSPFGKLLVGLDKNDQVELRIIDGPAHSDIERLGMAEAHQLMEYWSQLRKEFDEAIRLYLDAVAYKGDPRIPDYPDNVIALPVGGSEHVQKAEMRVVGGAKAAAATDGRVGDGILTVEDWEQAETVNLHNHEIYRLTANTLEPVAALGDLIIVNNYLKVEGKHLVAVAIGECLMARRFQPSDVHRDMGVFTAQAVNPREIKPPVIIPHDGLDMKKIVGTIFVGKPPAEKTDHELEAVEHPAEFLTILDQARLYQVDGQSAEPIALHGQYLIVGEPVKDSSKWDKFDGRLVIAYDADGASYFKRMRAQRAGIYVMESLNPNGINPAELLSAEGHGGIPQLKHILPVLGVLFEKPN